MTHLGKTKKLCPNGHLMDPAWEVCPYCPGDRRAGSGLARTVQALSKETLPMSYNGPTPELAKTIKISDAAPAPPATPATDAARRTQVMDLPTSVEGVGWLVGIQGRDKGRTHRVEGQRVMVGADAASEVALSAEHVSDRHASIRFSDQQFVLTDLDSTNGTYVNGEGVHKATLSDGDRVRFGSSEWIFKCVVFDAE